MIRSEEDSNMNSKLWTAAGLRMVRVPAFVWKRRVRNGARSTADHLDFMSEEHHLVREFAVRELPGIAKPPSVELIADRLSLPADRVNEILDDLEKHKTFICRNDDGAVEWAYPVTVARTPHAVTFGTGERLFSA